MTAIANHPHRVSSAVAGVRSTLASVAGVPLWSMDPVETTATIAEVQAAEAQLAELEARLLAHADRTEVAANAGATSTANWHAHATRTSRVQAHRAMRLAHGLEDHDVTRTALAAEHDAKALKQLGRPILQVASPQAADAHEAALLEKEERDAEAATKLVMWDDGHGKVHGRFTLDTLTGAALKKALFALAAPKHLASKGPWVSASPPRSASGTRSPR